MKLQRLENNRRLIGAALVVSAAFGLGYVALFDQKPTAPAMEMPRSSPRLAPNTLEIPALGVAAPLVEAAGTTEAAFQEALAYGVVHYPDSAKPGEVGNAYYFGHSSDFAWSKGDYKTVFATLPNIKHNEMILIANEHGAVFTYRVVETRIVEPDDLSVLAPTTDATLMLQTSYPVGTAKQRFIVVAKLLTN